MAKVYGAAPEQPAPVNGKGRALLCGAVLAAGVLCGVAGLFKSMDFSGQMAEHEALIGKLEAEIEHEAGNNITKEDAEALLYNAREQGEAVAGLQNRYGELDILTQEAEYGQVADELAPYLMDKSGQAQWYRPLDDTGYRWEFNTTYDFSGSSMGVLFTCWDDDDRLVAYTTGMYLRDLKQFRDMERHFTGEGYRHMDYVQPETAVPDASISGGDVAGGVQDEE